VKQKITLLETNDQRLGMFSILLLFWWLVWLVCPHVFMKWANTLPNSHVSRISNGWIWLFVKEQQKDILAAQAKGREALMGVETDKS
jgi:hypothetical protein